MALRRSIEIHDSILTKISFFQYEAQFHFSAYMHQSEGIPGQDPGSGWTHEAILHLENAEVQGSFSALPVTLGDGEFWLGHNLLKNEIPVPLRRCKGDVKLRLEAWRQVKEVVIAPGTEVELELIGTPKYVEEFQPSSIIPETPEQTMLCAQPGEFFLYQDDGTFPRHKAKRWVCGTELPSHGKRLIVACRKAFCFACMSTAHGAETRATRK